MVYGLQLYVYYIYMFLLLAICLQLYGLLRGFMNGLTGMVGGQVQVGRPANMKEATRLALLVE
jgi:hypothetical protein